MSNQTTLLRKLDPAAVARAREWAAKRLKELSVKHGWSAESLPPCEWHELQRLQADADAHHYAPYRNPRLRRREAAPGEKNEQLGMNRRQLRRLNFRRNPQ